MKFRTFCFDFSFFFISPPFLRAESLEILLFVMTQANQNRGNASISPVTVAATESPAVACGGERGRCERNFKRRRFDSDRVGHLSPNSIAIVETVTRVHTQEMRSSAAVAEFCRLSEEDSSACDCNFSECSQP